MITYPGWPDCPSCTSVACHQCAVNLDAFEAEQCADAERDEAVR